MGRWDYFWSTKDHQSIKQPYNAIQSITIRDGNIFFFLVKLISSVQYTPEQWRWEQEVRREQLDQKLQLRSAAATIVPSVCKRETNEQIFFQLQWSNLQKDICENNPTTNYLQLEEKSYLLRIFSKRKRECWVGKENFDSTSTKWINFCNFCITIAFVCSSHFYCLCFGINCTQILYICRLNLFKNLNKKKSSFLIKAHLITTQPNTKNKL